METWTALSIVLYTMLTLKCYKSSQPPGYIGCFNESFGSSDIFSRTGINNGTYCMRFCNFSRYRFAGTKGQYCKCYGINLTLNQSVEAECSYPCPGRRSEYCGGNNRISLYNITSKEKLNGQECVEDPHYGMFTFSKSFKEIKRTTFENNTATSCTALCKNSQYEYAGAQNKRCICGDNANTSNRGVCDTNCPGDVKELCGGEYSLSLYPTGVIITTNKTPKITTTAETDRPTRPKTSHKKSSTTHPSEPISTEVFVTENVTSNFNNTVDSSTSVTVDSSTSVNVDSSTSEAVDSSTSVTVDSSTSVSNETGNLHADDSASTAITVGISVPSVIAFVGLTLLIICLCARRRRRKSEQRANYQGNLPTTKCQNSDNETRSENNKLLENSNIDNYTPTTSQCNTVAEYSTVSVHPENSPESIQPCSTSATCAIYSHLQVPLGISKISPAENSYSHIGACKLLEQPKHSKDETDNTYNSLQSAQRTQNANKMSNDNGDQDSIYDKAIVGVKLPVRHDILNNEKETDNTYNSLQSAQRTNNANKMSNDNVDQDSVYDKAIVGGKLPVRSDILNNEYAQLKTVNTTKTVKEQEQSTAHKETVLDGENDKETEFYEQVDEADHHYFILEPQT